MPAPSGGAAGMTSLDARAGPVIDDHNVLLHAAMDGHGVALGGEAGATA